MSTANTKLVFFFSYLYAVISPPPPAPPPPTPAMELTRNPSTVLKGRGESGHRCLVTKPGGSTLSMAPLNMISAIVLVHATYQVEKVLSIPSLLIVFLGMGVNFVKEFFCIN